MNLQTISDNSSYLLTCEALGYLHNIGKLDDRAFSDGNYLMELPVDPSELDWTNKNMEFVQKLANGHKISQIKKSLAWEIAQRSAVTISIDKFDKVKDDHWEDRLRFISIAHKLGNKEFANGCHILRMVLMQGAGLKTADISDFINKYITYRDGWNKPTEEITNLHCLGHEFSFPMLLNFFPDKFHWREEIGSEVKRHDNLTFWLGDHYSDFSKFVRIMAVCHEAVSRGDKGQGRDKQKNGQETKWTNVFGTAEANFLRHENIPELLRKPVPQILDTFRKCASDGLLPINDVSLHSYCTNFGAFLKTALATILLTGKIPEPHNLRWRLLWFRHDAISWVGRGGRLADGVARQQVWTELLDEVQRCLEVELPLASEIYRDSYGAFYLAPDVENLLSLPITSQSQELTLGEKIRLIGLERSEGEIDIHCRLSEPCKGYDIKITPYMNDILPCNPAPEKIMASWEGIKSKEVCTVCCLRPIADNEIPSRQRVCTTCHQRRTGRSEKWQKHDMHGTIWTTELADKHGRCALLAGRLGIGKWINGELFQSLSDKWTGSENGLANGPSFTRVRDVWNMSESFWADISSQLSNPDSKPLSPIAGRFNFTVVDERDILKTNHAYELEFPSGRLQVVCLGTAAENEEEKMFCIIDRKSSFHKEQSIQSGLNEDTPITLLQRGGYGWNVRNVGSFLLKKTFSPDDKPFAPYIELFHDPHRFLAFLPGDQAGDTAAWIHEQYKVLYNRVQDRLPLQLGLVYFPERSPVYTVIDAGLKMLDNDFPAKKTANPTSICTNQTLVLSDGNGSSFTYDENICGLRDKWYCRPYLDEDYQAMDTNNNKTYHTFHYNPSTVDILHLSRTSKRHHVFYDNELIRQDEDFGPMPLSQQSFADMDKIWQALSLLDRSQLSQLEEQYEYCKRELADAAPEAIHFFLRNGLITSGNHWWRQQLSDTEKKLLAKEVNSEGLVWTTLKYRLHLLKNKPVNEKNNLSNTVNPSTPQKEAGS